LSTSINQNLYTPFKIPTRRHSRPTPSGKEQSWEGGGIENRWLYLLADVHWCDTLCM